ASRTRDPELRCRVRLADARGTAVPTAMSYDWLRAPDDDNRPLLHGPDRAARSAGSPGQSVTVSPLTTSIALVSPPGCSPARGAARSSTTPSPLLALSGRARPGCSGQQRSYDAARATPSSTLRRWHRHPTRSRARLVQHCATRNGPPG